MLRTTYYLLSVVIVGGLVFLSSCGKDDPKPKTKTDLISGVTWKVTHLKIDADEGSPETCFADNEFSFASNGTYTETENVKCATDDPASTTGTWQFKTNETIVSVSFTDPDSGFSISIDKQLIELTETTLKLKYTIFGSTIEETYSPK